MPVCVGPQGLWSGVTTGKDGDVNWRGSRRFAGLRRFLCFFVFRVRLREVGRWCSFDVRCSDHGYRRRVGYIIVASLRQRTSPARLPRIWRSQISADSLRRESEVVFQQGRRRCNTSPATVERHPSSLLQAALEDKRRGLTASSYLSLCRTKDRPLSNIHEPLLFLSSRATFMCAWSPWSSFLLSVL